MGTVWGAKGLDFYLLDLVRGRFEAPDLRQQILARRSATRSTRRSLKIPNRPGDRPGPAAQQYHVVLNPPRLDKQARFLAQSARFEAGQVFVPQDAPWLADWLQELLAFPNGGTTTRWIPRARRCIACPTECMRSMRRASPDRGRPGESAPSAFSRQATKREHASLLSATVSSPFSRARERLLPEFGRVEHAPATSIVSPHWIATLSCRFRAADL